MNQKILLLIRFLGLVLFFFLQRRRRKPVTTIKLSRNETMKKMLSL